MKISSYTFAILLTIIFPLHLCAQNQLGAPTSAPYKVGDYYNEAGLEGVVFSITEDGMSGKIVSLTQSKGQKKWATTPVGRGRFLGANDIHDGSINCKIITQFDAWQEKFPAIAWCASLGNGWYLPAIHEIREFITNPHIFEVVNRTLINIGATPIPQKSDKAEFWSSTENDYLHSNGDYSAWSVNTNNGASKDNSKALYAYVRAVASFPLTQEENDNQLTNTTSAPYKIGDYYNDGILRGVVFQINAEGTHGKIVSFATPEEGLFWAIGDAQQKVIGLTSRTNGKINMEKIKSCEGWQEQYPAFAWCAALGDNWYIPAIEEVAVLMSEDVHSKVNTTLDAYLSTLLHPLKAWKGYWSSTEVAEIYTPDEEFEGEVSAFALSFYLYNSEEQQVAKGGDLYIRAIAEF